MASLVHLQSSEAMSSRIDDRVIQLVNGFQCRFTIYFMEFHGDFSGMDFNSDQRFQDLELSDGLPPGTEKHRNLNPRIVLVDIPVCHM